jgi:hypothetical protein
LLAHSTRPQIRHDGPGRDGSADGILCKRFASGGQHNRFDLHTSLGQQDIGCDNDAVSGGIFRYPIIRRVEPVTNRDLLD